MRNALGISCALATAFALVIASPAFAADDGAWSVKKSSGEVWMGSDSAQQASVKTDEVLKPGDTIRTGRNGRVLLVRGEESILMAPNSVIGLPAEKKDGLATTITQQAGSILLEVEKKNVKHFEVETPYLAAVVKGTQFRVTVSASGATVDVVRGQVEVADFKSGQIAQVMPGQHATTFAHGNGGLSLGGSGALQPIQNGQPRASSVDRVPVPRNGLTAPNKPGSASLTKPGSASLKPGSASVQQHRHAAGPRPGVVRISSALGDVKLNVHRVTHGLARNSNAAQGVRSASRDNSTVWSSGDSGSSSSSGVSVASNNGNGGSGGNAGSGGGSGASGSASSGGGSVVAVVGGGANGGGNGNGNNGNAYGVGNGNGNGNNGNGNNGNGNGNGNGGVGNGRGNGNAKH